MPSSAPKSSLQKPAALLGLLAMLTLVGIWALGPGGGGSGEKLGQEEEGNPGEDPDDRYRGVMASEPDGDRREPERVAVVTSFFGVVKDAATDEPVPFLDLVVHHWPEWDSNMSGTRDQNHETLTRMIVDTDPVNGRRSEYTVRTDKYGEFQVGLSELRGHIALIGRDGFEQNPVTMSEGAYQWLENLPGGLGEKDSPLGFTAKIGPTIPLDLTAPGERTIEEVLEAARTAALGEGPEFFAYIDAGGDTRQGVDWFQIRYDVHPALERVYLEAFTPAGNPQRVSHTAPWIRLPAPLEEDRKPNGSPLVLHTQNRLGTMAGRESIPGVVGILGDAVPMGLSERAVVEGKVVGFEGLGVEGMRVHLRSMDEKLVGFDRGMGESLVSTIGGGFRIECIPKGSWELQIWGRAGAPLLLDLPYLIGEVTEMEVDLTDYEQPAPEIDLIVEVPRGLSKEDKRTANEFFRRRPKGDAILAAFRPRDGALALVAPTIPATVTVTTSSRKMVSYSVTCPRLPFGSYDLLLGRNPSSESNDYFVWETDVIPWATGATPIVVMGYPASTPGGWPWTQPLVRGNFELGAHFPMWWDRDGPVASLGLDSSPDAEAHLAVLLGEDWWGSTGQRFVGLALDTMPVLEPKTRKDTGQLDSVTELQAKPGWGVAVKVRIHQQSSVPDNFVYMDGGMDLGNLPGASIHSDGAFATRTDGSGRAVLGASLPPARLEVKYPGYHMLEVLDDPTYLPLAEPPIGQLVYQVLMVRD